jgi:hypothetical protein
MDRLIIYLLCIAILIKTFAYGIWEWREGNKTGACAVFVMSLLSMLPCFISFA